MKLIECYIENFGKISDKRFNFSDGFNLILAENGYGKTTLSVFIKCMLYGMDDTKKQNLDENERKKYLPWSGAKAAGTLTFENRGKTYRIERSFAPKAAEDTFALYDTSLGRESTDFSDNIGEDILGINADGFLRTLFLSERSLPEKNDNRSISSKLSELVGCDGDISSMTDALKLLDEQRKFYMKKGGSGEISFIKSEISRISDELSEIDVCEERIKRTGEDIRALYADEAILRKEEQAIIKERETLAKLGSFETYRKTLAEMNANLAKSEEKRDALIELFGGAVPTESELDRAKMLDAEIKRLSFSDENKSEEFDTLNNYFDRKASYEVISNAKEALERVRLGNYPKSDVAVRKDMLFAKRIPAYEELSNIEKLIDKKPALPKLPIALGSVLVLAGLILGIAIAPILFALSALGALFLAGAPIIRSAKNKKNDDEIKEFFKSLSYSLALDTRPKKEIISELRILLNTEEKSSLEQTDRDELLKFCSTFGKYGDPVSDAIEIFEKYERYKELLSIEKYKAEKKATEAEELNSKKAELSAFISRFNCKTDFPINELAHALSDYNTLSAEILTKRTAIASLSANHKLTDVSHEGIRSAEELNQANEKLSANLAQLGREKALLERQYRLDSERLDMREELLSKKAELEEKYNKSTDELETVMLTKKYLEAAKESMTTKYLGKTKAGFEKYSSIISGESGNFDMDTSFTVSKTEGAKTHTTEAYSRGIRELYALAIRFALIDSLYESEAPFVMLDDPFISLDDEKCKKGIEILKQISKERQIIYFTCSASRA